MNDDAKSPPANLPPGSCPGCGKELQPKWVVCPYCGLRLKPVEDLFKRAVMWICVLAIFVLLQILIAQKDQGLASAFAVIVGLPLAYVFGVAVLFRFRGRPLTRSQLGRTSVRAFVTAFLLLVILPVAIGVASLIFLFMACSGVFGH